MPDRLRFIVLIFILVFVTLACNAVTQPIDQAREIAATAESFATSMPVETLMAIPSMLPTELSGLDLTSVPGFDATSIADMPDCFNPKSDPLEEWNGIPVMPAATAGEECGDLYVYTVTGKPEDVKAYYDETLSGLGWEAFPGMGQTDAGGLFLIYQKDGGTLSIVVTPSAQGKDMLMVMLTKS